MNTPPLVSAIVLFHDERSAKEAEECIKSLQKQTIADQIEIIVVDNGAKTQRIQTTKEDIINSEMQRGFGYPRPSTSSGQARAGNRTCATVDQSFPKQIQCINSEKNLGYGKGNNLGATKANGTYILIINPDNRMEASSLEKMVQFLEQHSDVGIVGPQLVFPDGTIRDSFRTFPTLTDLLIKRTPLRFIFKKRMKRYLQWDVDRTVRRDVDWMCGACLLLRKSLYQELEGFDERFFLFFEDCDLCRRCWKRNLRVVYFPEANVYDNQLRLSAGGIFSIFTKKTVRVHVASAIKYFWKWRNK